MLSKDGTVLYVSSPTPFFTVAPLIDPSIDGEEVSGGGGVNPQLLVLFGVIPIILILIIVTVVCIVRRQRLRKQSNTATKQEYEPMLTTQVYLP